MKYDNNSLIPIVSNGSILRGTLTLAIATLLSACGTGEGTESVTNIPESGEAVEAVSVGNGSVSTDTNTGTDVGTDTDTSPITDQNEVDNSNSGTDTSVDVDVQQPITPSTDTSDITGTDNTLPVDVPSIGAATPNRSVFDDSTFNTAIWSE